MKKYICVILMAAAGTAVFGGDFSLSAGAGGIAGGFFSRYTLAADGTVDGARIQVDSAQAINQYNFGFFAFFDATYGVFSVFFQNGSNTYAEMSDVLVLANEINQSGKGWETVLGFSLLGKYPFYLNNTFTVFPLLGIEYHISRRQRRTQPDGWVYDRTDGLRERDKDNNAFRLEDWNSFWIQLGGGIDINVHRGFFIRSDVLYGFRLMTPYESKNLDMMKTMAGDPKPRLGGLTSGPSLRISAGFRFCN